MFSVPAVSSSNFTEHQHWVWASSIRLSIHVALTWAAPVQFRIWSRALEIPDTSSSYLAFRLSTLFVLCRFWSIRILRFWDLTTLHLCCCEVHSTPGFFFIARRAMVHDSNFVLDIMKQIEMHPDPSPMHPSSIQCNVLILSVKIRQLGGS